MTLVVRVLAIFGLGLTGALIHSWASPIILSVEEAVPGKQLPPVAASQTSTPKADPAPGDTGATTDQSQDESDAQQPASVEDDNAWQTLDPETFETNISLSQARFLYQYMDQVDEFGEPLVAFVDARGLPGRYEEGHITGAVHITFDDINELTDEFQEFSFQPLDMWIVIYCDGGDCDESENVRNQLTGSYNFNSVYIFKDGYPAWEQAGLPTTIGENP